MKMNMTEWGNSILANPDKIAVPVMTYPGLQLTGNSVLDMVTKGEVQYNCVKALAEKYPTLGATTLIMDLSVEAEAFGSHINFSDDEIPTVSKRLIDSFEQVVNLKIPAIGEGRTKSHLNAARLAAENITTRPIFGGIIGPYSLAGRLYDITEMMTAILIEPEGAHELLRICTSFLKEYALAFKNAGCNGIVIAEPAAGLLADYQCEEFSSLYVKQIVDFVQDDNFMVVLHNCGNTVSLVESMLGTGATGFHFGNAVDMLEILPQVPSERLVFGNLDPAGIIKNGTPEIIKAKTRELLTRTAKYSNFVISSGCDIPPETTIENIDAFFEAVAEYNKGCFITVKST
jgi:uroporphyrinogen decarboxylase